MWSNLTRGHLTGRPILPFYAEAYVFTDEADVGFGGTENILGMRKSVDGCIRAQRIWIWADRAQLITH